MEIIYPPDAATFLESVKDVLLADEVNGNLLLGIADTLVKNKFTYGDAEPFFAIIYQEQQVALMAIMTPPHKLLLYKGHDCSEEAIALLGKEVYAKLGNITGVNAERNLAQAFADKWAIIAGCNYTIEMQLRAFKLTHVNDYTRPAGMFRVALPEDLQIITQFIGEFSVEANAAVSADRVNETAKNGIANGEIYVWEDTTIVAIAKAARPTNNGMAIGYVYTPKLYRNKGYATAVVAELSKKVLASGKSFCTLYTDLSNPTSNSIYQKIGYQPVSDNVNYSFVYKGV
ncbi:MAG: GNAT family N-acetyltransferase [Filimonas sp.]|nr:GNAT family N-acetyltransferase [Filimonas sp.]